GASLGNGAARDCLLMISHYPSANCPILRQKNEQFVTYKRKCHSLQSASVCLLRVRRIPSDFGHRVRIHAGNEPKSGGEPWIRRTMDSQVKDNEESLAR